MRRKKILIADYSRTDLNFFSGMARKAGWIPLPCGTYSGVIDLLEYERPEVVLMDLKFCDGCGTDLLEYIRTHSNAKVYVATSQPSNVKADGVFKKPLDVNTFLNILK